MQNLKRIQSPISLDKEEKLEITLRPKSLEEFVGQDHIKKSLEIIIKAAKIRSEPVDHILLYGPPGLGKTTLAHIISNEMQNKIYSTSGPAIERAGDLAAILTSLKDGDILFIDEIHRLNKIVEEILYPAMEDFKLDIVVGKGPSARTLKLNIPRFTLIGATTRLSMLTSPFRDRFGIVHRFKFYTIEQIRKIIYRSSKILGIDIDDKAAGELAARSRKTPRIANRLLKRVRDFCQVKGDGKITIKMTREALDMLEIDELGLEEIDRKILRIIIESFNGGPVGIGTIAAAVSEEEDTIAEIYEPFLMQIGFLARTPRGRIATDLAYKHLGIKVNDKLL